MCFTFIPKRLRVAVAALIRLVRAAGWAGENGMPQSLGNVMRLLMALTILASVLVRPPGTMLVTHGDTLTYVLCTGGELETVRIALGEKQSDERDLSCDFFAAQIANLSAGTADVPLYDYVASEQTRPAAPPLTLQRRLWSPVSARAPPHVI